MGLVGILKTGSEYSARPETRNGLFIEHIFNEVFVLFPFSSQISRHFLMIFQSFIEPLAISSLKKHQKRLKMIDFYFSLKGDVLDHILCEYASWNFAFIGIFG